MSSLGIDPTLAGGSIPPADTSGGLDSQESGMIAGGLEAYNQQHQGQAASNTATVPRADTAPSGYQPLQQDTVSFSGRHTSPSSSSGGMPEGASSQTLGQTHGMSNTSYNYLSRIAKGGQLPVMGSLSSANVANRLVPPGVMKSKLKEAESTGQKVNPEQTSAPEILSGLQQDMAGIGLSQNSGPRAISDHAIETMAINSDKAGSDNGYEEGLPTTMAGI
jgi:hypothetical protein